MVDPSVFPLLALLRRELSRLVFLGLLFAYALAALAVCGGGGCHAGARASFLAILDETRPYLWQGMAMAFLVEFAGGFLAMTIGLAWDWWKNRPAKAAAKAVAEVTERERAAAQQATEQAIQQERTKAEQAAQQERTKAEQAVQQERTKAEQAVQQERTKAEQAVQQERAKTQAAIHAKELEMLQRETRLREQETELREREAEMRRQEAEQRVREAEMRRQEAEQRVREAEMREQNLAIREWELDFRARLLHNGIDPNTGEILPNYDNGNGAPGKNGN